MKVRLLSATLGLTLALSTLTGVASAGKPEEPGKSPDAPGQVKKAEEAPAPAAPAAASEQGNSAEAKAEAKAEQAEQAEARQETRASGPGVKPSNSTDKWTTCETGGGQGTSASCARTDDGTGSGSDAADASKQYGHGGTAAQIANGRGAPAGTVLTGPGNSQPHKVAVCPGKSNKSGGVDVHAVKSYDASACEEQQEAPKVDEPACPPTTTQVVTASETVVLHHAGPTKVVEIAPSEKSAHYRRVHPDDLKTTTVTRTVVTPGNCAEQQPQQPTVEQQVSPPPQGGQAGAEQEVAGKTAAPKQGVLGSQAGKPAAGQEQGGVLGEIGAVTQSELPFTGLPLWIALLVGAALVGAGVGVRKGMR